MAFAIPFIIPKAPPLGRGQLFSLRKKLQKSKKRAVLSLCQFCFLLKLLAPPRVEILHKAKFTRNHGAFSRFADHKKFANHSHASRFRRMFAVKRANITSGERRDPSLIFGTEKAINRQGFCFFLPLFLSKRKRGDSFESRRLS